MNIRDGQNREYIKSKYKLGQFVLSQVKHYLPFGIFVNTGSEVKGLIKIPDFLDVGEMYPEIGTTLVDVVVGYNESYACKVYLNAKPSVLHEALVPLQNRTFIV